MRRCMVRGPWAPLEKKMKDGSAILLPILKIRSKLIYIMF